MNCWFANSFYQRSFVLHLRWVFEGVEIYFDTPFILGAIGLEGESRQASSFGIPVPAL
jgi:hypothetical protein